MIVKIKDLSKFQVGVFGSDDLLKNFPSLLNAGVQVKKVDGFYYIMNDDKIVHDTAFFSQQELECMEIIND